MANYIKFVVRCRARYFTGIVLLAMGVLASPATAVDYFWNTTGGGPFTLAPFWVPFSPLNFIGPGGANDTVNFNLGVSAANLYTVTGVQGANLALNVNDDSVKLSIPGSYTVSVFLEPSLSVDSSPGKTSNLILAGGGTGILHTTETDIAPSAGSKAFVTADNLQWITSAGFILVGGSGTGQLNVQNNSSVSQLTGFIGDQIGSSGTLNVTGAGASWKCGADLYVGYSGDGNVNVQNGASVSVPNAFLGFHGNSTGMVSVTGAGSTWTSSLELDVGELGAGALSITAGGTVNSGSAAIGLTSSATGTATISDAGSAWNASSLSIAEFAGTGTVNIQNQGAVKVSGSTHVGAGGTINLDGGTLTSSSLVNTGGGQFHWSAGTLHLTGSAGLEIGSPSFFGSVLLAGPGTILLVDHALTVDAGATFFAGGSLTAGSVAITSGGQFFSGGAAPKFGTGLVNNGDLVFTAPATVTSPITNAAGARITTLAAVTFNDLVHGAGNFYGAGTVTFAGGFSPGNSPAIISFEGGIVLADTDSLVIELAGTTPGQFDQLQIAGNLDLAGTLNVALLNNFHLQSNEQFLIANVAGNLTGQFSGLPQGANLGNFAGVDLFITYTAGSGNDVALYTVPEPPTFALLMAVCLLIAARRPSRPRMSMRNPSPC